MTSAALSSGPPRLTVRDRIARIVLERPGTHNALNAQDVERLHAHLAAIDADDHVRVLVLTGSGDATFCSGASLGDMESGALTPETFEALAEALAASRVPSICALNGDAFGGGTELALCCDFRIGVFGSRVAVPAAKLGICYPLGGLRRYVEALGLAVASRLLLAGEEMEAEEMVSVGFLHRLVSPKDLDSATEEMAIHLASLAPLAVQSMKKILREVARGVVDERGAEDLIALCADSEDLQEGLRARREHRDPEFSGR